MAAEVAAQELDRAWEELRDGINGAYESRTMSSKTYMALYTHVYNYCSDTPRHGNLVAAGGVRTRSMVAAQNVATRGPNGQVLHQRIRDLIRGRLEVLARGAVEKNGEDLINFYLEQWETYTFGSKVIDGFCAYLNRHWVKREHEEGRHEIHQVYQLVMDIWKEAILEPLQEPMVAFILQLITRDRNGEAVDTVMIKKMTESLAELGKDWDAPLKRLESCHNKQAEDDGLGLYRERFEDELIAQTENYYAQEAAAFFQTERSVPDFMIRVEQRLHEEVERVRIYLHPSTFDRLMKTCETVLIEKHLPNFRETFATLLKEERKEDMGRLYGLVSRVTGNFTDMTTILQDHVTSEGRDQIASLDRKQCAKGPAEYVGTIMAVYEKFQQLANTEFQKDPGFMAALDRGCEAFINENALTSSGAIQHKSPAILSRYCDSLLKKGGKNHDDQELEDLLNQAMIIFKFIEDKDVFQKFYTKLLANRLVGELSSSDDMEALMITKLKAACGYEYTTKLHRMFLDIGLSRDTNEGFKAWLAGEMTTPMTVDFSAMILQSGSWPFSLDIASFTLPEVLVPCVNNFALYHASKHEGRKLNWLYSKSFGEVVAHCFGQKTYTFMMSTYSMSIILQFQDDSRNSCRIQELAEASQLGEDVVIQVVQQFMKAHLLRSDDPQDQLTSSSVIYLCLDYNNKRLKVNLTVPLKMEVKEDVEQVEKVIEKQRVFEIKAAIVRVMKTRKELGHQLLIGEIMNQMKSRFSPSVPLIKKCIEELIVAEYLRRKEGENTIYQYIS